MNKLVTPIIGLLAALAMFFAGNLVVQRVFSRARVDLTEGKLYTLSEGSRNIARSLKEPVRLTLYYSEKQGNDVPMFKAYAARVKEMLQEFASAGGKNVVFTTVNPEPFSDAEDRAVQAGLAGVPTGRGGDRFYFGLVGVNSTDKTETIPFFDPQKEGFLEYDVTRMVYLLSDAPKKIIGVMSWLPITGDDMSSPMMARNQNPAPPYQIYRQLKELFEVKTVATDVVEIPADVKTLLVIHPKAVSAQTMYAIDQFVLKGGRLVAMVDPLCESDVPPGVNQIDALKLPKASNLDVLLSAWGVEQVKDKVATDKKTALTVNVGQQNRPETAPYIAWLNLKDQQRDASDPVTGQLQSLVLATPGVLQKKEGAGTTFQPLLMTSTESMAIEVNKVSFFPEPKKLLGEFKSEGKSLTLAARVTGSVKSAFPEGAPKAEPKPDGSPAPAASSPHLAESASAINVIVVADCDMVLDKFWSQEERMGPISLGWRKVSDNGDFLTGALDNMSGSSDLMSLRARGKAARPFETVQQLERDAQQKYAAKETELQTKLRETEKKIADLQRSKGAAEKNKTLMLSPEQEAEIAKFRKEMVGTRKELRDVQHQLRKDIEGLGTRIKAVNMALMPTLVGVGAMGLAAYRVSRRKADRLSSKD